MRLALPIWGWAASIRRGASARRYRHNLSVSLAGSRPQMRLDVEGPLIEVRKGVEALSEAPNAWTLATEGSPPEWLDRLSGFI